MLMITQMQVYSCTPLLHQNKAQGSSTWRLQTVKKKNEEQIKKIRL